MEEEDKDSSQPLKMVDVSQKPVVKRTAQAEGKIHLKRETIHKIRHQKIKKGDVFSAAELAGILAVKKTPELIPLCHLIPISKVDIDFTMHQDQITVRCTVIGEYKTGVEMEALVGVNTALMTIWDMVKYLEKNEEGQYPDTQITDIKILKKKKEKVLS